MELQEMPKTVKGYVGFTLT